MLKYTTYDITFSEIPDETTLCINISNCPHRCPNCHSSELQENIGDILTKEVIMNLVDKYPNITCICFMGGDSDVSRLLGICFTLKLYYMVKNPLKFAWYSGKTLIPKKYKKNIIKYSIFDYIKLGPYIEELGPLNSPNTNQRLYKVEENQLIDITYKFWKQLPLETK